MSTFVPVNAAPMVITLGIDDKSIKHRPFERAPRAIHTPIVYLYCETGPEEAQLVYGNTLPLMYGDETLNLRGKFANHATAYASLFLSNANPLLVKRMIPKDMGPKATIRISAEVLEEDLDIYAREEDGSFKVDESGNYVITDAATKTVKGRKIKFLVSQVEDTEEENPETHEKYRISGFGKGHIHEGTAVSKTDPSVKSKIIPLIDLEAPHYGSRSNNYGIRIWAPTRLDANPIKDNILEKDRVYPFRVALIKRQNEHTSTKFVANTYGEKFDDFCLKPELVDTDYNKPRYFNEIVINNYQDLNAFEGEPVRYGPFGRSAIYHENLENLLKDIYESEKEAVYEYGQNELSGFDDSGNDDEYFRVNLFGLTQPSGVPYQTVMFDRESHDGFRFTDRSDLFMLGGSDGTMNDESFADLVGDELIEFGDPNSPYQDIIQYPCSFFWDSGFPLRTKYLMGKFISQRKNTNVVISSYIAGERPLTASEESARHIAIVERVRSYAESDYFATPTVRATVVTRSGKPLASSFRHRLPCSYELANMVSRLAAGSSFKGVYLFDRVPYNIFELLGDVSSLWTPSAVRNKDWAMGMMWPERITQRQVFFPASRTVYKEDTSVLTSFIASIILAECETVGILCHKQFTGGLYTKPQLKARVEDYCRDNLAGRFAELVRIEPECLFTDADNNRGYSWTLKIKVYIPMMRTVETLIIEAYNLDDIPSNSPAFIA